MTCRIDLRCVAFLTIVAILVPLTGCPPPGPGGTGGPDDGGGTNGGVDLGAWTNAPGNYVLTQGSCPSNDTTVSLVVLDGGLLLLSLPENDAIPLAIDNVTATATNVTAFGTPGHDLLMTLVDGAIVLHLQMPSDPEIYCDTTLVPALRDFDCFESTGRGTITLDLEDTDCTGGMDLDLASAGFDSAVVELDPAPYTTGTDIQTELVQLELAVDLGGPFGQIIIGERDDKQSTGLIQNVIADDNGDFVSGDSFFDIFIEVEIVGMELELDTGDTPFRLDAGTIIELPPLGTDYLPPPSSPPVELFKAGTSTQVGWFCHAQHTPTQVVPCD